LARGLADPYLVLVNAEVVGYGGVWNRYHPGRLMEFHPTRAARPRASESFEALLRQSGASEVEAQTNMPGMLERLRETAVAVRSEKILFEDAVDTDLTCPGARLRRRGEASGRSAGDWVLEVDGSVVGTGGVLYHYNPPYGDVFMEVREEERGRGYGGYLVQELKRICHEEGKRPAARCDPDNVASRRTLEKAGFAVCGELLVGTVPGAVPSSVADRDDA
jgi:GNAT superfamily N-acetyltransferase